MLFRSDTKTSDEIMKLFQRLNQERGMTIVFVTHDPETADYCQRVIHIRDGQIERDERRGPDGQWMEAGSEFVPELELSTDVAFG